MADLGRYLRRFRRLMSPPGRPGPMAVPSDRTADVTDELAELLAAVDAVDEEAGQIVADAGEQARRRREEAHREAERIRAEAHEQTEEERATVAADQRSQLEDQLQELAADAAAEADRVRNRGMQRVEGLAAEVAARVLGAEVDTDRGEVA